MEPRLAIEVVLFGRPGCHLCEDVADQLEALAERRSLHVSIIDITADFELHRELWDKIPVVRVGEHTLRAPVEPQALAALIEQAA